MLSVETLKNIAEKLPHEKRGMPFISVHLLYNCSCFHLQYLFFLLSLCSSVTFPVNTGLISYVVELVYVSGELQTADVCTDMLMHLLSPWHLSLLPIGFRTSHTVMFWVGSTSSPLVLMLECQSCTIMLSAEPSSLFFPGRH